MFEANVGVIKVFRVAHQSFGESDLDFSFSAMLSKYYFFEFRIRSITSFLSVLNFNQ